MSGFSQVSGLDVLDCEYLVTNVWSITFSCITLWFLLVNYPYIYFPWHDSNSHTLAPYRRHLMSLTSNQLSHSAGNYSFIDSLSSLYLAAVKWFEFLNICSPFFIIDIFLIQSCITEFCLVIAVFKWYSKVCKDCGSWAKGWIAKWEDYCTYSCKDWIDSKVGFFWIACCWGYKLCLIKVGATGLSSMASVWLWTTSIIFDNDFFSYGGIFVVKLG